VFTAIGTELALLERAGEVGVGGFFLIVGWMKGHAGGGSVYRRSLGVGVIVKAKSFRKSYYT
jgi:hypothetical protein